MYSAYDWLLRQHFSPHWIKLLFKSVNANHDIYSICAVHASEMEQLTNTADMSGTHLIEQKQNHILIQTSLISWKSAVWDVTPLVSIYTSKFTLVLCLTGNCHQGCRHHIYLPSYPLTAVYRSLYCPEAGSRALSLETPLFLIKAQSVGIYSVIRSPDTVSYFGHLWNNFPSLTHLCLYFLSIII